MAGGTNSDSQAAEAHDTTRAVGATQEKLINPNLYTPEMLAFVQSNPILEAAAIFGDNFNPNDKAFAEGKYRWVAEYAPKLFESKSATFQKLDDKASSVLTWISGGAGLLTAGVTLAVSDSKMHWVVAAAFAPSLVCSLLACIEILHSRKSSAQYPAPDVQECIGYVQTCYPKGEIAVLSMWHKAITSITIINNRRARQISTALLFGAWAVILLCIPFIFAVVMAAWK